MGDTVLNSVVRVASTPASLAQSIELHFHCLPTASPIPSFRLPIEVWEVVIGFVESSVDLASCCLTCRSWVPRCRYWLYISVELTSLSRRDKFANCLEANTNNALQVKYLRILPQLNQGWVSVVPLDLAPKLTKLSKLSLHGVDLSLLHPVFFKHLSFFPPDLELELHNIETGRNFQSSVLKVMQALPRMQKLHIIQEVLYNTPSPQEAPPVSFRVKVPSLRHLHLECPRLCRVVLDGLLDPANSLTNLSLILPCWAEEHAVEPILQTLNRFLSSCSSLCELFLGLRGTRGNVLRGHISFISLSSLRRLRLHVSSSADEDVVGVARLLSSISAQLLEYLELGLNNHTFISESAWEVLNNSLLSRNVRGVQEIGIFITKDGDTVPIGMLSQLLPALAGLNVAKSFG